MSVAMVLEEEKQLRMCCYRKVINSAEVMLAPPTTDDFPITECHVMSRLFIAHVFCRTLPCTRKAVRENMRAAALSKRYRNSVYNVSLMLSVGRHRDTGHMSSDVISVMAAFPRTAHMSEIRFVTKRIP